MGGWLHFIALRYEKRRYRRMRGMERLMEEENRSDDSRPAIIWVKSTEKPLLRLTFQVPHL